MIITNSRGQIIGDLGIGWSRNERGMYSWDPRGYFIDREDGRWVLYRKTRSAIPERVPFVRQVLARGTMSHCMRVAEIYEVRRVL